MILSKSTSLRMCMEVYSARSSMFSFQPTINPSLKISRTIRNVVQEQIRSLCRSAREKIDTLYFIEEIPFTQNEDYFFNYRSKLLARYRTLLRESRGQVGLVQSLENYQPNTVAYQDDFWNDINTILTTLANRGIHGVQASDLVKLLPNDSMDPALEVMAEVRAYFQGESVYSMGSINLVNPLGS